MEIKILGTGCPKCKSLEKLTRDVVSELDIKANISKVEDIVEIMRYGILATPAMVIDEKIVLKGYLPSEKEIKRILTN